MLAAGLVLAILAGCGKETKVEPPLPRGALVTFVSDAPFCDALSFRMQLNGITLNRKEGGTFSVLSSAASIRVNFGQLRDFSTILNVTSIPTGTYDQATLTLLVPQVVLFDPTKTPPTTILNANFSTLSPVAKIDPPIVITKDAVSGWRLDFDVRRSLEVDSQGQLTGNGTPVFSAASVAASGSQGFGEMDDLIGFVRSVTPTLQNSSFVGSFLIQLFPTTDPVSTNLTSNSQVFGVSALNELPTGSFVEVDGFVDGKGNLVANAVEVENRENPDQQIGGFVGTITSMTKDSNGNLTQFNLYVSEEHPDLPFDVSVDSTVLVNVSSLTVYQFSSRSTNFATVPFDATSLAVGQQVVVHGVFTRPPATTPPPPMLPPVTVAADKIYLKLQAHQGNFSSLVQNASDDKTGAFWLAPCESVFQGTRVLVLTNSQTTFLNLSGLSALTPQPGLLVKGLLFFQAQGGTFNGVTIPSGTLVLVAKQVHLLP